jgi:hypothetical protein
MVSVRGDENLRLLAEAPERHRVDDPVAVALKGIAGPPRLARAIILVEPPPRLRRVRRVAGQRPHLAASFTIS